MNDFLVPDGIEPVVGYRGWNLDTRDPKRLLPMNVRYDKWHARQRMEAVCEAHTTSYPYAHTGPAPANGCKCGLYASKYPDEVMGSLTVKGEVYLWGKIIEGDLGYRGQYGYPKYLTVTEPFADYAEALENQWLVPVEVISSSDYILDVRTATLASRTDISELAAAFREAEDDHMRAEILPEDRAKAIELYEKYVISPAYPPTGKKRKGLGPPWYVFW